LVPGRIGSLRARLAAKHPSVHYLAVSDLNIAQAKKLADLAGADFYSASNEEVIARPEVTAVFISTPEGEHVAPICQSTRDG
jgi:predicted dehydrogenase